MTASGFTIVGRSSSSFTRVARIFAAELGVDYDFQVVLDLQALDPSAYAGNPALKLPSLRTEQATWFGALNICRELSRASQRSLGIIWPEALETPLLANMQELVLQALSTEVGLIMSGVADEPRESLYRRKLTSRLSNVLSWLDANLRPALAALPAERDLSYLEVTLFCLVTHLDFRKVMSTEPFGELTAFARAFGERPACEQTQYRFDS